MRLQTMTQDFISKFNKQLVSFEKRLADMITASFRKNGELTTHDIIRYLRDGNSEFAKLYKANPTQGWYRSRKILETLRRNGLLAKSITGVKIGSLPVLNYKWARLEGVCRRCGKHLREHSSGWWMVCGWGGEKFLNEYHKKIKHKKCLCPTPDCAKCLLINCKDENCGVHSKAKKEEFRNKYKTR